MAGWQIADYGELLPEEDVLVFNSPGGEVKYKFPLFISTATALKILQHSVKIQGLFRGEKEDDLVYDIMEPLFMRHHGFMNREWIGKNFGYTKLLRILAGVLATVDRKSVV